MQAGCEEKEEWWLVVLAVPARPLVIRVSNMLNGLQFGESALPDIGVLQV